MTTQIFTARTTDGSSASFESNGRVVTVVVNGTFDGATVTIEVSPNLGTTWIPTTVTFTSAGVQNFVSGVGFSHRATVSSAGASTSLNTWIGYGIA
jgi:hypothetical protein